MIERVASGKWSNWPKWRFYFWGWVAILFAFAAWQRFSLPLDPIGDWDVWGYLAPALRKLVGGEFGHTYERNFVYSAFVFFLLRVLLLVPDYVLSRDDELTRTFLPATLFVNHAALIRDQMADDLQRVAAVPYSHEWLGRVHATLRTEIAKSFEARPGHYWSLGFDPDYLLYDKGSTVAELRREFGKNVPELCAFYRFYYWRIGLGRPLAVARKIQTQMSVFYSEMCPAYNREKSLPLANKYGDGVKVLRIEPNPELWRSYAPAVEFVSRTESLARNAPIIRQPIPIRIILSFFAGLYRPLLWIAIAVSAAVSFQPRYGRNDSRNASSSRR